MFKKFRASIASLAATAVAGFKATLDSVVSHTPLQGVTPAPIPDRNEMGWASMFKERMWWRNSAFTRAMSHKLRNDKALMYSENTLLQGLLLRHFKVVA